MNKRCIAALIALSAGLSASSQVLFTYGKQKSTAQEFLRAYNKNNAQPSSNKAKAIRDYLDLYINSRLKIQEAYERGYDTLSQIRNEVQNLRAQIIENHMSDPDAINRLSQEAFQRSQKDIHVGHIFISFQAATGITDTAAARKKLNEVIARLNKKEDFGKVAAAMSDEPSAKTNNGDMGYITVFTLPYIFENIIYNLGAGKTSAPFTSKIGFHIFKNLGERKAIGKLKVQQILLAFPPGASDAEKKSIAALADSLYRRILKGDDFGSLASAFSNDHISAASSGNVPDISVGQFDADFEKILWSLPKDGTISKPFVTAHGYHIVKRIAAKPVVTDATDKTNLEELKLKIMADDRWKTAKDFIYDRVKKNPGIQRLNYADAALWSLSDSLLDRKPGGTGNTMNLQSGLFKIGDITYTVTEWIAYCQAFRYKSDRSGIKTYPDLMDEFVKNAMYEYYRAHLEDFSDEFRMQMQEFRDGNLFFEIMQQEIWNKTQSDSSALMDIYEKNKSKYNWLPSADAVIFFCSDAGTCKNLLEQVKKNPSAWKSAAETFNERVVADSGRYEWAQLPGLEKATPIPGMLTQQVVNETDNTASFAYIIKVHKDPSPRTFNEAKGLVMNDYQLWLEEQWIAELKKKYPVTIDKKVLANISR